MSWTRPLEGGYTARTQEKGRRPLDPPKPPPGPGGVTLGRQP